MAKRESPSNLPEERMELARLIEALSSPAAYPGAPEPVEVRHTHISVVFLAGDRAYKIKKPVSLGFLDFSTLELRRHFCDEEVRLNRRLAPGVYLGVVPVAEEGGGLKVEGNGPVVEWAVKMVRLPDEATLEHRLRCEDVGRGTIEALARRVAAFHASERACAAGAHFGSFEVVAGNARDNLTPAAAPVGVTLSQAVLDRLRDRLESELERLRPLIEARAAASVPRNAHGDLRLGHVYLFPERAPPDDLVIIDCIEFSEQFRCMGPVADMAFLVMDLLSEGRPDLAEAFCSEYFRASGDREGEALVPFYTAYRAAVRAKVDGLELTEREVPAPERDRAMRRARGHWLLALGQLEPPETRPCLVPLAGLPGAGKSTLARSLAEIGGFTVVRSDAVRKKLARGAPPGEDIYTAEWNERTYGECRRRIEAVLFEGGRALVDANFRQDGRRREFLDLARSWGVPAVLLVCRADPEVVRRRLEGRKGDASDATWAYYQQAAREWEAPGPATRRYWLEIDAGGTAEQTLEQAAAGLRARGLL
jgi:aminoglycoside phosphotransferase family enzyme/predicted kinase